MKSRTSKADSRMTSSVEAVRQVVQSEAEVSGFSPEETSLLASHLTDLLARVERVRALGPTYSGISISPDVQQLLVRLEVGSSLETGVH